MAIKGLKEALAKKLSQQRPDNDSKDDTDSKITPAAPVRLGYTKPQKKAAGRGR